MSKAARESFAYCSQTCPDVDRTFSNASDKLRGMIAPDLLADAERVLDDLNGKVKEVGTERLRAALVSACSDKQDLEIERDELVNKVLGMEAEITELKYELKEEKE